ncbi:sensor histidine kinase [Streptomyces similanensis]|uniref:MEDS domain-containing protein n=1 Tax=Streptomyces similanensis TaxID=1274988 RepID=A0ABP9JQZ3_9ACTN
MTGATARHTPGPGSAARHTPGPGSAAHLAHQGLIYGTDEEFLSATVPFCLDGLEQDDAVLAVTTAANIGLLRGALGGTAEQVEFVDADDWYRAPGRTLGAYHRYVDRHTADGAHARVRVIGEPVWHGRDRLETAEWTRYEAAINVAFADCPAWIVCPYDTRALPADVVAGARHTHPELVAGPAAHPSDHYTPPDTGRRSWERRLAPVAVDGREAVLDFAADLSEVRAFVAETAGALGLSGERAGHLVFAANEVATNAVRHGGGHGRISLRRAGRRIVCDVANPARGGVEWYTGYLPPDRTRGRGHGLWTVRQLCDLVEIDTDGGVTTVRLHLDL